jgi:hypothetical protein
MLDKCHLGRLTMPAVLVIVAASLAGPALARAKTDVLVMKNGDRITCEVKGLDGGILRAELPYVDGTIAINWLQVARLDSTALFLIQLQDGSTYSGRVITPETLPDAPVKFEIEEATTSKSVAVEKSDVAEMKQTSDSIRHRFDSGISLGAQYSKGNDTTQYNLAWDLGYQAVRWGGEVRYNSNLSSSTGAQAATRNQLDFNGYHLMSRKNNFWAGSVGYLQSSVQGIERQVTMAGSVGRYLKNTNRVEWIALGGLGWQRNHYEGDTTVQPVQDIGVAVFSSTLKTYVFKKTRLDLTASFAPALTDPGRNFIKTNLSYYLKLFGKIDWDLSFYGNWDTRPPMNFQGSDYGTSIGLRYSFGNR